MSLLFLPSTPNPRLGDIRHGEKRKRRWCLGMSLSWNSDKCSGIYDGCGMGGCSSHRTPGERRRPWVEKTDEPGWCWYENASARGPLDLTRPLRVGWSPGLAWLPPGCLTEGQLGYPWLCPSLRVPWWGLTVLSWDTGEEPAAQAMATMRRKAQRWDTG